MQLFANALIAVTNISPFSWSGFISPLATRSKALCFANSKISSDRHISLQGYCICLVYRVIGWTVDWGFRIV
jgi:hypothetical protein